MNSKISQSRFMAGLLCVLMAFATFGCANTSKQDQGMVIGAVLGGVIGGELGEDDSKGSRNTKILLGALVGGLIGSKIGEYMDDTDRLKAGQVLERNPTGVGSSWVNPDTSYKYTMTPTNTYDEAAGPCRDYTTQANIGGNIETVYGTACRQSDGSWQAVN